MVVINMEIPKGCQHCKFFRKHAFGNGLDYSYSCDLGATDFPMPWIRQMEERAKDCPLVEIGTCMDCRNASESQYNKCIYCSLIEHNCSEDFYCKEYKKRGSEDGSN